jgi:hypothetical protein
LKADIQAIGDVYFKLLRDALHCYPKGKSLLNLAVHKQLAAILLATSKTELK